MSVYVFIATSELFEESYIVLIEEAEIVDVVATHNHTLKAKTECESGVFLGIDTAVFENLRMDHTSAEKLDITLVLTH